MHCLNKLGYNISIKIEPETRNEIGYITLAFA